MTNKLLNWICCLTLLLGSIVSSMAQEISVISYTLDNGMQVFIWPDDQCDDVHGQVVVRAGSKNDPEQYTGLAHYLEHLMFKGNHEIGALDWEKEQPLYEQIIAKYDERAQTTDAEKKAAIDREINQLTIQISEISLSNEFSTLVDEMGGTGLNAGTSYDQTVYYNDFPANQLERFLTLYADRLRQPVFRTFQYELETVYEEYNMYEDRLESKESQFLLSNLFEGHPYQRPVIGLSEHLKNPRISKLIEFYNTWYVPGNMALILCGNVDAEQAKPLIEKTFGTLPAKEVPAKPSYPDWQVKGRKELKAKLAYFPHLYLAYKGLPASNTRQIEIDIFCQILSNASQTGLLDKLSIDGDLMGVSASNFSLTDQGRIVMTAIPAYDPNQRAWGSFKAAEKMLIDQIEKVKRGEFDPSLLESIKKETIRDLKMSIESNARKASMLASVYSNGLGLDFVTNYIQSLEAISLEDIQQVAKEFCTSDYLVFHIDEGKPSKVEKLEKPKLEPSKAATGRRSDYAMRFSQMTYPAQALHSGDASQVSIKQFPNTKSTLYYTQNTQNDVFSLVLKYGVGTEKMPYLEYSTSLMNNAGIMKRFDEPQAFKKAMTDLNVSCRYSVSDSYLYVFLEGMEENLIEALKLMSLQILMPKLDQKQFDNIQGGVLQSRFTESKNPSIIAEALQEYMLYQEKSAFIDRPTVTDVFYEMGISKLTGEFQRATNYTVDVHYYGSMSFDQAYELFSHNLPWKEGESVSTSPEVKEFAHYDKPIIYFVPNSETKQAQIFFFAEGNQYDPKNDLMYKALNNYLGAGGLNSLIFEEIREKNAMAYTAYGVLQAPEQVGKPVAFHGYVGTQSDKAIDAIRLYMGLINDMPIHQERETILTSYLQLSPLASQPSNRMLSLSVEDWLRKGYQTNPSVAQMEAAQQISLQDVLAFYQQELKGKTMIIGIIGDPKLINQKELKTLGNVKKLSAASLFSAVE